MNRTGKVSYYFFLLKWRWFLQILRYRSGHTTNIFWPCFVSDFGKFLIESIMTCISIVQPRRDNDFISIWYLLLPWKSFHMSFLRFVEVKIKCVHLQYCVISYVPLISIFHDFPLIFWDNYDVGCLRRGINLLTFRTIDD